jgi:hypothetical protein
MIINLLLEVIERRKKEVRADIQRENKKSSQYSRQRCQERQQIDEERLTEKGK